MDAKVCYVNFKCPEVFTMDEVQKIAEDYLKSKFPNVTSWGIGSPEYKYSMGESIVFKVIGSVKSHLPPR